MSKEECKCESGPVWSRWMRKRKLNDHRQYKFCLHCYTVKYRENKKK